MIVNLFIFNLYTNLENYPSILELLVLNVALNVFVDFTLSTMRSSHNAMLPVLFIRWLRSALTQQHAGTSEYYYKMFLF